MVAGAGEREHRGRHRSLTAADQQRADAALEVGDAALDRGVRGVADARVAVAVVGLHEPLVRLFEVVEDETGREIDRRRAWAVRVIELGARVDLPGREPQGVG